MNRELTDGLIIDDRHRGDLTSNLGTEWRVVTDQVMGGVSEGKLIIDRYKDRPCLRMHGAVSTDHNGGFLQIALALSTEHHFDASAYTGVALDIAGNGESYNLHLRTTDLQMPWESYRASFMATTDWQTLRFPFSQFKAHRTSEAFHADRLKRIGLVAIGRDFVADLCLASIKFYSES